MFGIDEMTSVPGLMKMELTFAGEKTKTSHKIKKYIYKQVLEPIKKNSTKQ